MTFTTWSACPAASKLAPVPTPVRRANGNGGPHRWRYAARRYRVWFGTSLTEATVFVPPHSRVEYAVVVPTLNGTRYWLKKQNWKDRARCRYCISGDQSVTAHSKNGRIVRLICDRVLDSGTRERRDASWNVLVIVRSVRYFADQSDCAVTKAYNTKL